MATFNIEGLLTIYGELELTPENGHTSTDWEAYVDGVKVKESLNDKVNLTSWNIGLTGNDGKPYNGTNGVISGKVKVHVGKYTSEYFYLICKPKLGVTHTRMPYLMRFTILPLGVTIVKYSKVPYLHTGVERGTKLDAVVLKPTISINKVREITKSQ